MINGTQVIRNVNQNPESNNRRFPELVYEERTMDGEPTKFYGFKDHYKSKDTETGLPTYALMIFDKKRGGFRIVPVESHIKFEKHERTKVKAPEVIPANKPVAEKKVSKRSGLDRLKRLQNNLKSQNKIAVRLVQSNNIVGLDKLFKDEERQ